MTQTQMTPKQLRDLETFNGMLSSCLWKDPFDTASLLAAGRDVSPEGTRELHTAETYFQVQIHIPVNMLTLKIVDIDTGVFRKIHIFYNEQPDEYISWLSEVSPTMNIEEYPKKIIQTFDFGGMVLLELKDGGLIDLNPSMQQVPLHEAATLISV